MHRWMLGVVAVGCFFLAGCALLDQALPPQLDQAGNPIPGSRQPSFVTQAIADTVPYGGVVLNVLLLALAGYEKFRQNKVEKGLLATLKAGELMAKDPAMAELWQKVKEAYEKAHDQAGVTQIINQYLAKLKV